MPLLICIVIALMDQFGSCDLTLPDMGVAQCFLGSPWGEQFVAEWTAFFSSPEFLYFHSILIALQAANVLFFLLTVYYLVDHWRNSAGIIKSETRGNFLIVLKLFFIMGKWQHVLQCSTNILLCSGIPWFGEFISHLITHKNGPEDSFWFRFSLDLLNLFTVSIKLYLL